MQKILTAIETVQGYVLGGLMTLITLAYGVNVLVREVRPDLATHLVWIEELSLYALVWMVFLALSIALSGGRHIGMRVVLSRLPAGAQRLVKLAINLVGLGFSIYLVKIGVEITAFVAASGQRSPTLGIPVAWLYIVLPTGFLLLAVRYLIELVTPADRFSIELDPTHHL